MRLLDVAQPSALVIGVFFVVLFSCEQSNYPNRDDSDISINYSPLTGNLQGANLGVVAFDVLKVTQRMDGSSSDLPRVSIRIRNAQNISALELGLFANAPIPQSSSVPFDIAPPSNPPAIVLNPAN